MNIEQTAGRMHRECLAADSGKLIFNDFQKALPALRQSGLYALFSRMPKARLMHAHIEATFDLRYVLSLALSCPDTYVFTQPETSCFRYLQVAHKAWFEDGVVADGWENLQQAVAARP